MGYSSNIHAHSELKIKLHSLPDAEVYAIWVHVQEQGFHPDTEFAHFGLEGKISDDEFVDVLTEEIDARSLR